jgi:hypothetical protein
MLSLAGTSMAPCLVDSASSYRIGSTRDSQGKDDGACDDRFGNGAAMQLAGGLTPDRRLRRHAGKGCEYQRYRPIGGGQSLMTANLLARPARTISWRATLPGRTRT